MNNIKHVGRFIKTGRKCIVAYRTLPGDAYHCLVIPTEAVEDSYHDSLINLVETNAAQTANEFAEVLARNNFSDGSVMLASLHKQGKLVKIPTDQIEMIPNTQTRIKLDELNLMIAEQRGVAVDDLALGDSSKKDNLEIREVAQVNEVPKPKTETVSVEEIPASVDLSNLSVEEQATKLRGMADKLSKQAAELRRQAEDLVPKKKNVTKKAK
jgi:hypothetical protein